MELQQNLHNIFFNPEQWFRSWAISTVALIVLYPLYFIPLIYFSFIAPTGAIATLIRITIIFGLILAPTVALIGSRFEASKNWLVVWAFLLIILIIVGAVPYARYQQSTREEFSLSNIPPYPSASFQGIKYSPGNTWSLEPSATITFGLEDADSKFVDIVDFYHQELVKSGWVDERSPNSHPNEAYWESQPGYMLIMENWFLLVGPKSVNYISASISKPSAKTNTYSVSVGFYTCLDILCRIDHWLFEPTAFVMNQFKDLVSK